MDVIIFEMWMTAWRIAFREMRLRFGCSRVRFYFNLVFEKLQLYFFPSSVSSRKQKKKEKEKDLEWKIADFAGFGELCDLSFLIFTSAQIHPLLWNH